MNGTRQQSSVTPLTKKTLWHQRLILQNHYYREIYLKGLVIHESAHRTMKVRKATVQCSCYLRGDVLTEFYAHVLQAFWQQSKKKGSQLNCKIAPSNNTTLMLYYVYTGTFLWASTGQPSLFDSVNSNKTELKWAGPNQASMVCTARPARFGSAQFGPLL